MFTDYEIIRSKRKSIEIQVKPGGRVIVRAPRLIPVYEIQKIVDKKESWIVKHKKKMENIPEPVDTRLSKEEAKELIKKANQIIPERVAYYAEIIGVTYGTITLRNQKTRWGSCTSEGNLNFNIRLMRAPIEVLDSVIVHELCHRKHMNHSKRFYAEVYKAFPEYDKWHDWLKKNPI